MKKQIQLCVGVDAIAVNLSALFRHNNLKSNLKGSAPAINIDGRRWGTREGITENVVTSINVSE